MQSRDEFASELEMLAEFHAGQANAYQTWLDRYSEGKAKRSEFDISLRTNQRDKEARTSEILTFFAGKYRDAGTKGQAHNQG
jgi:hypothetical protein